MGLLQSTQDHGARRTIQRSQKTRTVNHSTYTYVSWTFRKASRFFDIVLDTGTGVSHNIVHSLSAVPKVIIRKSRSGATQGEG